MRKAILNIYISKKWYLIDILFLVSIITGFVFFKPLVGFIIFCLSFTALVAFYLKVAKPFVFNSLG